MDDIVQNIRTKAKHRAHLEDPQDDCPLCAPAEAEEADEDDLFLDGLLEEEDAPAPDKKAERLNRLMKD